MAAAFLLSLCAFAAHAQTLIVLYNFGDHTDGANPYAGVTLDQQGRLYGTTYSGGAHQVGVVYRIVRQQETYVFSPLYSFGAQANDGQSPLARVVFGPDGLLYGTTSVGGAQGYGTVFRLQPPPTPCRAVLCLWTETVIHSFTLDDGAFPGYGDLTFDQAGNIYGTTFNSSGGGGVVFKLTRSGSSWTESVLWHFSGGNDGSYPVSGVIFDNAGNLYGTTTNDGSRGSGTVYELSPTQSGWTETTLYSFDATECCGDGGLTWDTHGNLFGISGIPPGKGEVHAMVYELTPQNGSWSLSWLHDFGSQNQGPLASPTFDARGNLYGPLPDGGSGFGLIFRLTPSGSGWLYSTFYQVENCGIGSECFPLGTLSFDANGNMYGTTELGGYGNGTVWELSP
jgi:uncharacterized repeat protein (TIGR03803 family)